MLHGRWRPYRATGFGIVVTTGNGHLVAYGQGQPPHWCKTAASAEAWALCNVVSQAPFLPSMRTDCLSLITTAAAGIAKATEPRKVLARIWALIGMALDGDIQKLSDSSTLIWVPAHMSPSSIGEAKRSDGARLTHIDWRANRLADGLAKQAAAWSQPPTAALRLLASALAAVKHAAMLLAGVTHAANNHVVVSVDEEGNSTSKKVRDSVDKPKVRRVAITVALPSLPAPPPPAVVRVVRPWTPPAPACGRRPSAAAAHMRRAEAFNDELLHRRVSELGAQLPSLPRRGLWAH